MKKCNFRGYNPQACRKEPPTNIKKRRHSTFRLILAKEVHRWALNSPKSNSFLVLRRACHSQSSSKMITIHHSFSFRRTSYQWGRIVYTQAIIIESLAARCRCKLMTTSTRCRETSHLLSRPFQSTIGLTWIIYPTHKRKPTAAYSRTITTTTIIKPSYQWTVAYQSTASNRSK